LEGRYCRGDVKMVWKWFGDGVEMMMFRVVACWGNHEDDEIAVTLKKDFS
jgi:hypothetical protein